MIGDDASIAFATDGSLLKVDANAPTTPRLGEVSQTISQGKKPSYGKYCYDKAPKQKPSSGFFFIVRRTSAFIMALSMLVIVSKTKSPPTIKRIDIMSIGENYTAKRKCLQSLKILNIIS